MKWIRKKQGMAVLALMALLVLMTGCGKEELAALDSVDVETVQETVVLNEAAQITAELSYPVVSAATNDTKADQVVETLNAQFQQDAEAFVQQAKECDLSGLQEENNLFTVPRCVTIPKGCCRLCSAKILPVCSICNMQPPII